ncbi:hypothetical protein JCM10295v2_005955 [Rhodotorula toruloides]
MASPRPTSPFNDGSTPVQSGISLAVPQIPPHNASSSSSPPAAGSPLAGSPMRSPSPLLAAASSALQQTRIDSPLPPNAVQPSAPSPVPLTEAQKAEVIRRHLLTAEEQQRLAADQALTSSSPRSSSAFPQPTTAEGDPEFPTPYHLQGGDVVAGVYKWAQQAVEEAGGSAPGAGGSSGATPVTGLGVGKAPPVRRSRSMASIVEGVASRRTSLAVGAGGGDAGRAAARAGIGADEVLASDVEDEGALLSTAEMLQPGGFRRDFVFRKMAAQDQQPTSSPSASAYTSAAIGVNPSSTSLASLGSQGANGNASGISLGAASPSPATRARPTRSFIDFLSLYGHFGGEDLEEIEEEEEEEEEGEDEEALLESARAQRGIVPRGPHERTPLIRARSSLRGDSRKRVGAAAGDAEKVGDATVTQAVLMLLKSFVGTGVLFLGKAFFNGGILFSTITLCFVAMISLYSFLLLVQTRQAVPGSFGDIGGALYGRWMRWAILSAIVLSQIGFVAAYTIFVAQNMQAFFLAVSNCKTYISTPLLILAQLVVFLPLAMIRNIQKLSSTALVADAFILFGLVYIFSNEAKVLAQHGVADVKLFNPRDFPLLIGTAVFAFEGIGLVLPVRESMRDPSRFPAVLSGVMVGTMVLFASGGVLAYLAYGSKIQTVVFVNLPQDDKFVQASQFLYSLAILLSTPLQLFPAVRIMENGLFPPQRSGKRSLKVKWEKNGFRAAVVVGCAGISWAGASDLDKFVSLIGSLACVPLGFIFPALLHLKACARTRSQKAADVALLVFGVVVAVFSTSQTINLLLQGSEGGPPAMGQCPPRS